MLILVSATLPIILIKTLTKTELVWDVSIRLGDSVQELSRESGKSEFIKLAGRRYSSPLRVWRGSQGAVSTQGWKANKCELLIVQWQTDWVVSCELSPTSQITRNIPQNGKLQSFITSWRWQESLYIRCPLLSTQYLHSFPKLWLSRFLIFFTLARAPPSFFPLRTTPERKFKFNNSSEFN